MALRKQSRPPQSSLCQVRFTPPVQSDISQVLELADICSFLESIIDPNGGISEKKSGYLFLGSEFSFLVAYKIWQLDLLLISGRNLQNRWIEGS